jgi:O-antigen/teichoic acid export membrane protein
MTTISADAGSRALPSQFLTSFRPSFTSNLLALLSGQVGCSLLGLATEICYARLLGPVGRGQVSLSMMVIAVGALLGGLGGEIPIIVWTAESKRRTSEWLPAVMLWGSVGSFLAVAAWPCIYWRLHPQFLTGITALLAIIILPSIPIAVFDGYLTAMISGLERFRLRAVLSLLQQLASLVGFLSIMLVVGRNAGSAMLGYFLGLLFGAIVTGSFLGRVLQDALNINSARNTLRSALSFGLRAQFGNIAAFFNYRLDVFIVNYYLDPAHVGLYAVGVVVSESLWQIPQAAATALTPRTARTIDDGATEFTCFILRQVLFISAASGLLLAALCPLAVPLVFGTAFASSVPVIWWILPGTVALSLAKVVSSDFAARGKPEYPSLFSFAALLATVLFDFLLIPRMGILGAALASSIAYTLDAVLLVVTFRRQRSVPWRLLIVPKISDFKCYRQAWLNLADRLRPAIASTSHSTWN